MTLLGWTKLNRSLLTGVPCKCLGGSTAHLTGLKPPAPRGWAATVARSSAEATACERYTVRGLQALQVWGRNGQLVFATQVCSGTALSAGCGLRASSGTNLHTVAPAPFRRDAGRRQQRQAEIGKKTQCLCNYKGREPSLPTNPLVKS